MSDRRTLRMRRGRSFGGRVAAALGAFLAITMLAPIPAEAQYFGRNKVQYDQFNFRVLTTPNFEIYFYDKNEAVVDDLARMSERWYERLARLFQHEFEERKPLIFYADHPDFQQTNTIGGAVSEGVGGVTESLKNRVVMPIGSSYAATDHVLGHELVHAFQYNIAQSRRGGGLQGLFMMPLWMVEGMAEYLSVGREDAFTSMWLRDAILRDDFPTLDQLTRESRFFPYRFGQAFWTYIGGTYGDEVVVSLFRSALRTGWAPAIQSTLGISPDSLSTAWRAAAEEHYRPLMADRLAPGESGSLLLAPSTGAGRQNVAPSISPDGTRMAYISEKDLFTFDLFLADARTGETIRRLSSASSDPHTDALRFIDSSGSWSPDSRQIAFVVFANGLNEIVIADAERGREQRRIRVPRTLGEITGPAWSPDGRQMVFSGQSDGSTDLYLVDLETEEISALTEDRHTVVQPTFSPDGRTVAFVSDRGPETDFDRLVYSEMRIALMDLESREIQALEIFGNVRHTNPQFTPDGRGLYFLSDPDGFSDIFRLELETGEIQRVTRVATGVSGITDMSPAMSVAAQTGTVVFSVFDEFEYHVYSVDSRDLPASPVVTVAELDPAARFIPPAEAVVPSRVMAYLADPETALAPPGTFPPDASGDYRPGLSLDFITQPSVAVGSDRFGTFAGGSIAAFFSDMLGNRNLGVAVQAQGTLKDIGGQFIYQNLESRWNWGVGAGRIPYLFFFAPERRLGDLEGTTEFVIPNVRLFQTQAFGLASYPLNQSRRFDFSAGVNRYSYDVEEDIYVLNPFGQVIDRRRVTVREGLPDPVNLFEASAAYVGDNSFFGFVSPIRGSRFRAEVGATFGSLNYNTVTLDYRRYMNPITNLTFAFRGLHFGRYGSQVEDASRRSGVIQDLYLGREYLIRGYSAFSFDQFRECNIPQGAQTEFQFCPVYERLFGQRIGVLSAEMRVPLVGTDRLGIIDFGFVPTEIALFGDAGMAWNGSGPSPTLEWSRTSLERIPVASAGVSSRFNILGALILEVYYVYPFQRPDKGAHWGFQLAPGW
jgi:Tol biopolymer transport system component